MILLTGHKTVVTAVTALSSAALSSPASLGTECVTIQRSPALSCCGGGSRSGRTTCCLGYRVGRGLSLAAIILVMAFFISYAASLRWTKQGSRRIAGQHNVISWDTSAVLGSATAIRDLISRSGSFTENVTVRVWVLCCGAFCCC